MAKINQLLIGNQLDAQIFALVLLGLLRTVESVGYFQDIQFTIINSKIQSLAKVQRFRTVQSKKSVRCRKDQSLMFPSPALHLCTQAGVYLYHVMTQSTNAERSSAATLMVTHLQKILVASQRQITMKRESLTLASFSRLSGSYSQITPQNKPEESADDS